MEKTITDLASLPAPKFGPAGATVFDRTYSRPRPDGTHETWAQTVRRVVDGNLAFTYGDQSQWNDAVWAEADELFDHIYNFRILPAGRHLWVTGVKGSQYNQNCWVSGFEGKLSDHFEFTFMRLMEGGGVGANYSSKFLEPHGLPARELEVHIVCDESHADYEAMKAAGILSTEYCSDWEGAYEVVDSREGWAAALVDLIDTFMTDEPVKHSKRVYDISYVRPAGARLKTFGGTASGPSPFAVMMHKVADVLNGTVGGPFSLSPLDAMEMDHAIAECVVSGGVRRSARMAIVRWDDPFVFDFIESKSDFSKHWTTNISVEIDDEFIKHVSGERGIWAGNDLNARAIQALQIHASVVEGMLKNGEPGYWNSTLSNAGELRTIHCTNPCFHPDTIVETVNGPMRIADITEPVQVYTKGPSGGIEIRKASASFMTKRNAETVRIGLTNGDELIVTPDHLVMRRDGTYVRAGELKKGDPLETLCRARRGWRYSGVKLSSQENRAYRMEHRMVYEGVHGVIPKGFDVDHINRDHHDNRIDNLRALDHGEHARLSRSQVPNDHQVKGANGKFVAGGKGGKKSIEEAIHPPRSTEWGNTPRVKYVEPGPVTDVYDITVDETHNLIANNVVAHNCGEIALDNWEPCVLAHVNLDAFAPSNGGDVLDWGGIVRAHELTTRFAIRATFADASDSKSRAILNRNRRIGVGHLGVQGFLNKQGFKFSDVARDTSVAGRNFRTMLASMYAVVDKEAADYAYELRIPKPIKLTTVAPTGSIAKLPGVTEGIHPIYARYYEQRIRYSIVDERQAETVRKAEADGFAVEVDQYDASGNTMIVVYPSKNLLVEQVEALGYSDTLVEQADELDLETQLAFQAMYQKHWADNAVSMTVNFPEGSLSTETAANVLGKWLPKLKGTTLMPDGTRPQAPYTRLSREQYETYGITQVDDGLDIDCSQGGACPIR